MSAVNEELDRMAAVHGFQVFWEGFLSKADAYEMGVPAIPLGQLYSSDAGNARPSVRIHHRATVERIDGEGFIVNGEGCAGDVSICALPFERLEAVGLPAPKFEHSPHLQEFTCGSIRKLPTCRTDPARPHHPVDVHRRSPGAICNWWSAHSNT